jgi:hypothetical protein
MKEMHKALHRWDKEVLKGPRRRLRELQKELNIVMSGGEVEKDSNVYRKLEQEELYWVQLQQDRVN